MPGKFDELVAKLDTIQKADGAGKDTKTGGDDKGATPAAGTEPLAKAFEVTLPDGTKAQAFDGTDALKALHAEHDALRTEVTEGNDQLLKAFDIVVGALGQHQNTIADQSAKLAEQDTVIKALNSRLDAFGATGVGRRTVLTVAEKLTPGVTTGAGSPGQQMSAGQVLMKAQNMAKKGTMSFPDAARVEAYQLRGLLAPDDILQNYPELTSA